MNHQRILITVPIVAALFLSGCSQTSPDTSVPSPSTEQASATPTPVPTQEPIETIALGDTISVEGADFSVNSAEKVDSYPNDPDCGAGSKYSPTTGHSLYALEYTVKNTGSDILGDSGDIVGNAFLVFRDSDGNEMQVAYPGCKLEGDEAFDGIMNGETKSYPVLIEGSSEDSSAGWIELSPFNGDSIPEVILLDDDLKLYVEDIDLDMF